MQDRQPGAPGQYKAILTAAEFQKMQAGEQFTITMTRDDQPIVEGTPYSKSAVLPDELAAIICPDVLNPTPADALSALLPRNGRSTMTGDLDMGTHRVKNVADPEEDGDAASKKYVDGGFRPSTWMPSAADVGAAPAGYGLGAVPKKAADCDDASINGWYYIDSATANRPEHIQYGVLFPQYRTSQGMVQECADVYGLVARRYKQNGVWGPWEYQNPPMVPGVEYRTTKRHNGNVVYAKCVNLGALPNTGDAQPYLGYGIRRVTNLDLLAVNAAGKSHFFAQLDIAWNLYWHTESDDLSLLITTKSDRSSRTGYAIMEFTRS